MPWTADTTRASLRLLSPQGLAIYHEDTIQTAQTFPSRGRENAIRCWGKRQIGSQSGMGVNWCGLGGFRQLSPSGRFPVQNSEVVGQLPLCFWLPAVGRICFTILFLLFFRSKPKRE